MTRDANSKRAGRSGGRSRPGLAPGGGGRAAAGGREPRSLAPAPDPRHPAYVLAALAAAACILVTVSFTLFDTDMWQHLAVGRAIWQLHAVPTRQLWTWPTYGVPDVNASWGFRALIWPLWSALGVPGLYLWRWASTLAVFTLLALAARRMGAKGFAPLVVLVLCSLTYRQRAQIRPETLVSILLAAQLLIHESWRSRTAAADPRPWLILIAWLWANAHISYWMGLTIQGIYLVAARAPAAPPAAASSLPARAGGWLERAGLGGSRLPLAILAASCAVSFVNPWGWRALWQPFEYFLYWRHEPVFKSIGELAPVDWAFNVRNLLPLLVAGWLALMLWRARSRGWDAVELLMFGLFVPLAIGTQRFVGFLAVIAAPYLARDLDAWVRSSPARLGSAATWMQGVATALLCVAIAVPEWRRVSMPLGIGIDWRNAPVRASDFLADHDVHGRMFNQFAEGGYIVYRFWPDRSRLPFMDIHQAGTREDRYYYAWAQQDSMAWRVLDNKYRFDEVMLFTQQHENDHLLDLVGADTTRWALVESDDAASLFLRRDGPYARLADEWRYRALPPGRAAWYPRLAAAIADSAARRDLEREFRRSVDASPYSARALIGLSLLADAAGREAEAMALLDRAVNANPQAADAHRYRAELELGRGETREALADLERELEHNGPSAELDTDLGRAYQQAGDPSRARSSYRRAIERGGDIAAARDSLARLDGSMSR
jgi:hypothetical protein